MTGWGRAGVCWAVIVVAACGGGDDDDDEAVPTTTTTTTVATTTTTVDPYDGAKADDLLLTAADLGPGWVVGTTAPTRCGDEEIDDRFGSPLDYAQVGLDTAELGLVHGVALHADADAAQAALEEAEALITACDRNGTADGIDFTVAMGPTGIGPFGDDFWASSLTIEGNGVTIVGQEALVRQGRALVSLNIVGLPESVNEQMAEDLVTKALEKSMPASG